MPWIFIGLVIYTICITSTDAIHFKGQSFSNMDMVNEKMCYASIEGRSSLTTRERMLPDNENLTPRK